MQEYIKLPKSFSDWRYFSDANALQLFLYLIIHANTEDCYFQDELCKRGELITSVAHLSDVLRLSTQQVRTIFKKLNGKEIVIKSTNRNTHIIVCNFDSYQGEKKETNKRITNEQQTNNKRTTNEQQTNNKQNEQSTTQSTTQNDTQNKNVNNSSLDNCKDDEDNNDTHSTTQNTTQNTTQKEIRETEREREAEKEKCIKEKEEEKSKEKENTQSNNARENFLQVSDDSGNNTQLNSEEKEKEKKVAPKRESRFTPPTLEEVKDYEAQKGYTFSAEKFWGYYESNGWRVGKNPMRSWHGACVTWQGKQNEESNNLKINQNATIQREGGRASANEPEWLRHQRENEEYLQYHLKRAMSKLDTRDDDAKNIDGIF